MLIPLILFAVQEKSGIRVLHKPTGPKADQYRFKPIPYPGGWSVPDLRRNENHIPGMYRN
ncbi:alanine--tRNA ligase [Anopheles sinensis]|uniref:Alanine--tRNA ligase n=1 Tax=Anopheles sinensis TaxID=74873 RepID=A0A084WBU8_ANOSI|nr:alanine--tRNA ligase [Anopheles sinensis]